MPKTMRKFLLPLLLVLTVSCAPCKTLSEAERLELQVQAALDSMTLREKVGQLFYVRPESLNESRSSVDFIPDQASSRTGVTAAMKRIVAAYPVGGVVLFAYNITGPEQLRAFTDSLHALPCHPLVAIDEEGGRVARIAANPAFDVPHYASMSAVGQSGNPEKAYACGQAIGRYLADYGIDVDFAPVADVNTNPANPVIGKRAFSENPETAAAMVVRFLEGLQEAGVLGCLKHFPGHGDTRTDSHYGYAQSGKTWEEMLDCELVPFKAGIAAGAPMVMSAHISAPAVTGTDVPSTLSPLMLTEKLRGELGFEGVIVTDGLGMGAITRQYSSAEAAVKALQAGADILLLPENFFDAFDAVLAAVEDGTLTSERIDRSVRRILRMRFGKNFAQK